MALELGGEVVSCDSVQLYRGLDIGSAKPSLDERRGVPHHMLDVADPREVYSAGRYAREAGAVIDSIFAQGGLPIVCGGTGLYLKALCGEMADIPDCPRLDHGPGAYGKLEAVDPATASKLSPNDKKRIWRALDVFEHTGRPISAFHAETPPPRYDARFIGVGIEREELYSRIDRRVEGMLAQGLPNEVAGLLSSGIPRSAPAMLSLGYKEMCAYLAGETSLEEAAEAIKTNTRRYAKRQITWFSRQHPVQWVNRDMLEESEARSQKPEY